MADSAQRLPVPSARIRVLQVIGNAIVGGMESWVERLICRLPAQRYAFTALCPFESPYTDRLREHGVEVFIAPMSDDPPWATVQMAAAIVQARQIDLLHAHLPRAHLLAALVGSLTGRPVLSTVHGRQVTMQDLEAHRTSGSHLSVVCQQSYFHALGLGVSAERLSCEPNGVDCEVFQPRAGHPACLRQTLGLAADTPIIGVVGRLSPEKGPEVAVRAALLLRGHCPQAHWVFVGEGPMHDDLQALIGRLGLRDHVHLVGLRHDMPAVYNDLDTLVSGSHSEAMPLALMEAMASGVPAVATRVGGVPDIVEHGHSGWLVAPGDFEDLSARTASLLADAATRRAMGRCARARAATRLTLEASVSRVASLLERLAMPGGLTVVGSPLHTVRGRPHPAPL